MTTYYIDFATGADNNNGTATGTPFEHCPGDDNVDGGSVAAGVTLNAGDTCVFKGGITYTGRIDADWSGSSGNVITYISGEVSPYSWGAGRAVISGTGISLSLGSGFNGVLSLMSKSYLTVKGLEVINCISGGYYGSIGWIGDSGGNIIIDGCHTHDGAGNGIMFQGLWDTGTNPSGFTIVNCELETEGWHGLQIRGGINNLTIEDDIIHDNGAIDDGDGIFIGSGGTAVQDTVVIRGNVIYDNFTKGPCLVSGNNILIEDNYFYNTAQEAIGLTIATMSWQPNTSTNNVIVRNNVIDLDTQFEGAIRINCALHATHTMDGIEIYNNIIIQRGQYYGIWISENVSTEDPAIQNVVIKNNIIESEAGSKVVVYAKSSKVTTGFACDYNHYTYDGNANPFVWEGVAKSLAQWKVLGWDTFVHVQDVDPDLDVNYRLNVGSSCIDAGVDLSGEGFSDDKDGVTRPRGPAWDIGAYEYSGGLLVAVLKS